jgi:hypothetical protein
MYENGLMRPTESVLRIGVGRIEDYEESGIITL